MRLIRGYHTEKWYLPDHTRFHQAKILKYNLFTLMTRNSKDIIPKKKLLVRGFSFDACTLGLLASHSCMPVAHSIIAKQAVMYEISYE